MRNLALVVSFVLSCTQAQPPEVVEGCDHSSSSLCDERSIRKAAELFFKNLVPGGRFTVLTGGCTSDQVESPVQIRVPPHWGSGAADKRRTWLEIEERHLDDLRLRRPERCSPVVGMIWRGSRLLQQSDRPVKELWIDSDLREVSSETGFNFEKAVPSPEAFLARVKQRGLLPDLRGVHLFVYHVHDDATPDSRRWTPQQAAALRAAWLLFFQTAGVDHVEFRAAAPWEEADHLNVSWGGKR